MLLSRNTGLQLEFENVLANEYEGSANWKATYIFSQTGRKIVNKVASKFEFLDDKIVKHTDVFDLEPGHTAENPRLRRLKDPIKQHPYFDQTLRHPKILDIVSQLIGPGLRSNGNKLNMKYAEFGSPVEWHQDWSFYPHTNDDLLAVGIALDPMTMENGCLLVIPGSHKGPVIDHHSKSRGVFVGAVTDEDFTAV